MTVKINGGVNIPLFKLAEIIKNIAFATLYMLEL